ncbi:MAG: HD domain-containing protein [Eubacteriales bacterium]|nr:HD domain-containing protein [Eubacteriales bacterium]
MKDYYIKDLKTNEDITSYFMVKSASLRVGSNRKTYLDLVLGDATGEINAKKWDIADEEVAGIEKIIEGNIIRVRAIVTEWNGMKQLKVSRIRLTGAEDMLDINDYVKAAPEDPKEMYDYIYAKVDSLEDQDLRKLCTRVLTDRREKIMYYPAASKNHHAEMAGLLWHVKRMLMTAEKVCEVYSELNRDLLMAGVVLHDIEKMIEIESNELGISSGYSFEGKMLGHLVLGVRELEKLCGELDICREKTVMLEHMVISHHYEPEYGSPRKPLFPEAEMLHYLDMIDSKMYDMEEAISMTEPGEFSDRVWTLDNRSIYRSSDKN